MSLSCCVPNIETIALIVLESFENEEGYRFFFAPPDIYIYIQKDETRPGMAL